MHSARKTGQIEKGLFKDDAGVDVGKGPSNLLLGVVWERFASSAHKIVEHHNILGINSRYGH